MRYFIVAGNWKMNKTVDEAVALVEELNQKLTPELQGEANVIVAPPYVVLPQVISSLWENSNISVAAQNCHQNESGAYTGEVSAQMLKAIEADAVIIGHSERREYFKESNADIAAKVDAAIANELVPIFCCGEVLEERKAGEHFNVIKTQIEESLFHLTEGAFSKVVVAYEPVWAIGTGETATPEQAQEIHAFIRGIIAEQYNQQIADDTSILYGGSCKPGNAKDLFANPDVDGGLIGGASLKADDFIAIVEALKVKS
ncbi:MAG: triose-phosphate isomerase [Schleiferiaceae bacterium]|nr:triose-phosphate isomerase [Schleiferiaceae bacterium]